MVVAMALIDAGYRPVGIRLDSGDIVAQSIAIKEYFTKVGKKYKRKQIAEAAIIASDGITEDSLYDYNLRGEATSYGVGTNLVTCKKQPALGGVYKLVALKGQPRIKLSEDPVKRTIPGKKEAYRVFDKDNNPICDVMATADEGALKYGVGVKHWFYYFTGDKDGQKEEVEVRSTENLLHRCWGEGEVRTDLPTIQELRQFCMKSVNKLPEKHRRKNNPKPYPLFLTEKLYQTMERMIKEES